MGATERNQEAEKVKFVAATIPEPITVRISQKSWEILIGSAFSDNLDIAGKLHPVNLRYRWLMANQAINQAF